MALVAPPGQILSNSPMDERAFKSLLDTADGFVIYRIKVDVTQPVNGTLEFVSASLADVMGVSTDTPLDQWFAGVHEEDQARVLELNQRCADTGCPFDATFRVWHEPKNQWRWIHAVSHPVFDGDGQLCNYNGMMVDVTDQRQAEAKAAALHEQLKEAHRLEALGLLAGGIAHDFNNLLMVISGSASLIKQSREAGDWLKFDERLDAIGMQVQRATELTSQLLGYARRSSFDVRTIDLAEIGNEVVASLSRTRKDVRFVCQLPAGACVKADASQIERVFVNLIVNALDVLGPADGRIELSLVPAAPGGKHTLRISDNGPGISADAIAHIFDPFFTTKGPGLGTGLGLSASHGIVESLGGKLTVESVAGQGATFTMTLPSVKPDKAPAPSQASITDTPSQRILVIDDEEAVRNTISDMLSHLGNEVVTAAGVEEATAACRLHQFDVIFLDLIMPGVAGAQLARKLHEVAGRFIPFFVLSGYANQEHATEAAEAGALGFLRKPVRLDDLRTALSQSLTRSVSS